MPKRPIRELGREDRLERAYYVPWMSQQYHYRTNHQMPMSAAWRLTRARAMHERYREPYGHAISNDQRFRNRRHMISIGNRVRARNLALRIRQLPRDITRQIASYL